MQRYSIKTGELLSEDSLDTTYLTEMSAGTYLGILNWFRSHPLAQETTMSFHDWAAFCVATTLVEDDVPIIFSILNKNNDSVGKAIRETPPEEAFEAIYTWADDKSLDWIMERYVTFLKANPSQTKQDDLLKKDMPPEKTDTSSSSSAPDGA